MINNAKNIRNPCDELQCDKSIGSYCEINLQGKAFCKCRNKCEKLVDHVCGSDRISYENECVLHKEACFSNQMITRLHAGICDIRLPAFND
ncbi:Agrin [Brachionus plicatilis]|uniref:Agrin n=1 Tax=Brachionus plicatilis TaxID=10195 RepID=A0A3M7T5Y4_BRAPC|nr:Agrin [Brachionus plicatilis]